MKQLEHELPGVASLHGGLKRNEGVGSEQIAFHPDTHTFSIIPGRKPALTISSVTDSTDILLAATPQMLVGNITQALLSRQKITDPTTTLVLAQKSRC